MMILANRTTFSILLIILLVVPVLAQPGGGDWQPPPPLGEFPYFEPTLEIQQAGTLWRRGKYDEAMAAWFAVADNNPRSRLGVESLMEAAFVCNTKDEARAIWRRIANEYAGSRFGVWGDYWLAMDQLPRNLTNPQILIEMDRYIESVGGPKVATILSGAERAPLVAQFRALPIEIQLGLAKPYYHAFSGLLESTEGPRVDDAHSNAEGQSRAFAC